MNKIIKLTLLIISFTLYTGTHAANLRFLNDAPVSYFAKDDTKLMESKVYEALNNLADGEHLDWQSPDLKKKGRVIIEETLSQPVPICRRARILNYAKNQNGNVIFIFCKDKDNKWKIAK